MNEATRRQMALVAPRFKGQRFDDFRESCQPPHDWRDHVPPDDWNPPAQMPRRFTDFPMSGFGSLGEVVEVEAVREIAEMERRA